MSNEISINIHNTIRETVLTAEFGTGFDVRNLQNMRQFYLSFQIRDTLCPELSWSHYRLLMRIEDESRRDFYLSESAESNGSVRQLERQINSFYLNNLTLKIDFIK